MSSFLILIVVSLLIIAIGLVALPFTAKWGLVNWLENQGLDAHVEKINVNFRDASVDVYGASGLNSAGKGFNLGHFHFKFAWRSLRNKTLFVENIKVSGLQLDIEKQASGWATLAGINIPKNTSPDPNTKHEPASPWGFQLADVSFRDIEVCIKTVGEREHQQQDLCFLVQQFDWQGDLSIGPQTDAKLVVHSDINLRGFSVLDKKNRLSLIANETLSIDKLQMDGLHDLQLRQIKMSGLKVFAEDALDEGENSIGIIDQLALDDFRMTDLSLIELKSIQVSGLGLKLLRDKQAQWEINQRIAKYFPASPSSEPQATEKKKIENQEKPAVKIGAITLIDSRRLALIDNSLTPPFIFSTRIKSFSLKNLDTQKPEQKSELQSELLLGEYGAVELNGDIQLFSDASNFSVAAKLSNIDLRPYSSFLKNINQRINSGQLNADVKLFAKKNQLESLLNLKLQSFELDRIDKQSDEAALQIMGLPLNSALNLLRNRDDIIRLKLPITGDIANPKFGLSDAIFQAVTKALKVTVINYYTPFGLVAAAQGVYDFATALRFAPIVFAPASAEIQQQNYQQLDQLLRLFLERPKLRITLCGFANKEDLVAFSQPEQSQDSISQDSTPHDIDDKIPTEAAIKKLESLAASRGERVKAYLVSKKIKPGRIILCQPKFEANAISGVEISI